MMCILALKLYMVFLSKNVVHGIERYMGEVNVCEHPGTNKKRVKHKKIGKKIIKPANKSQNNPSKLYYRWQ